MQETASLDFDTEFQSHIERENIEQYAQIRKPLTESLALLSYEPQNTLAYLKNIFEIAVRENDLQRACNIASTLTELYTEMSNSRNIPIDVLLDVLLEMTDMYIVLDDNKLVIKWLLHIKQELINLQNESYYKQYKLTFDQAQTLSEKYALLTAERAQKSNRSHLQSDFIAEARNTLQRTLNDRNVEDVVKSLIYFSEFDLIRSLLRQEYNSKRPIDFIKIFSLLIAEGEQCLSLVLEIANNLINGTIEPQTPDFNRRKNNSKILAGLIQAGLAKEALVILASADQQELDEQAVLIAFLSDSSNFEYIIDNPTIMLLISKYRANARFLSTLFYSLASKSISFNHAKNIAFFLNSDTSLNYLLETYREVISVRSAISVLNRFSSNNEIGIPTIRCLSETFPPKDFWNIFDACKFDSDDLYIKIIEVLNGAHRQIYKYESQTSTNQLDHQYYIQAKGVYSLGIRKLLSEEGLSLNVDYLLDLMQSAYQQRDKTELRLVLDVLFPLLDISACAPDKLESILFGLCLASQQNYSVDSTLVWQHVKGLAETHDTVSIETVLRVKIIAENTGNVDLAKEIDQFLSNADLQIRSRSTYLSCCIQQSEIPSTNNFSLEFPIEHQGVKSGLIQEVFDGHAKKVLEFMIDNYYDFFDTEVLLLCAKELDVSLIKEILPLLTQEQLRVFCYKFFTSDTSVSRYLFIDYIISLSVLSNLATSILVHLANANEHSEVFPLIKYFLLRGLSYSDILKDSINDIGFSSEELLISLITNLISAYDQSPSSDCFTNLYDVDVINQLVHIGQIELAKQYFSRFFSIQLDVGIHDVSRLISTFCNEKIEKYLANIKNLTEHRIQEYRDSLMSFDQLDLDSDLLKNLVVFGIDDEDISSKIDSRPLMLASELRRDYFYYVVESFLSTYGAILDRDTIAFINENKFLFAKLFLDWKKSLFHLENLFRNIQSMARLEKKIPGIIAFLSSSRFCDLSSFHRYPEEVLISQYTLLSEAVKNKKLEQPTNVRYGICLFAKDDYNDGSVRPDLYLGLSNQLMSQGIRAIIIEAGTIKGALKRIKHIYRLLSSNRFQSRGIEFTMITAHGTENSFTLSRGNIISIADLQTVMKTMGIRVNTQLEMFSANMPLIFNSCSVGRPNGIGQRISETFRGLRVVGPNTEMSIQSLSVDFNADTTIASINAKYTNPQDGKRSYQYINGEVAE